MLILYVLLILVASILQASTGYGFSILATPFLLLFFEPMEAIQINLILSLFISIVMIGKVKVDVDQKVLKRLIIGSIFGLPLGMVIFLWLPLNWLKLGIGILILVLTVLMIAQLKMKQTRNRDYGAGGLSGTLTTSIGMPGPPLLLYFSGTKTNMEILRGTTIAFYLYIYVISLTIQMVVAGTTQTVWLASLVGAPVALIGIFLGQLLFKVMSQTFFSIISYSILLFTGLYLCINQLFL
ncbi:sulfite exporter TauE/SafE family protein [Cytobacillus kochii]|uniref:sulfite exporter TauE/SafE family protein n=1 Tax=Cytobacillus kochii TaxID=859143 RepID=UPI00402A7B60